MGGSVLESVQGGGGGGGGENEVKRATLTHLTRDGMYDCFLGEITCGESVKYLRYCFVASDSISAVYFGPDGQSASIPERCFEYLYTNDGDVFHVPEWAKGAVSYHIFPERFNNGDSSNDPEGTVSWGAVPTRTNFFGGDIKGIIQKLDYLSDLQIDLIYLNPIFASPSNHKYDTADYYAVDPAFGSLNDLKALIRECHRRHIRVILDGVFNHCGYEFGPFQDVLKHGEASQYKDWFYIESFPVQIDPPNYECVGYYKWMPKIRFRSREVRDYFLDVGAYWIREADIDGWRLDVADETDFTFWQEFRRMVKAIKPNALLIGETWKDGRDLLRGDEMDSVMNYLFYYAVVDFFAKDAIDAEVFNNRINRMLAAYPPAVYPLLYNLIGSHDTGRFLSLCGEDERKLKLAAAFQMTFPGISAIYYGDETGMDGDNDPDCRRPMNWNHIDAVVFEYYKRLIALRKMEPCLMRGEFASLVHSGSVYAYARRLHGETVYVTLNNSDKAMEIEVPLLEEAEPVSLLDGKCYNPEPLASVDGFINKDVHEYRSKFRLMLPAYQLDIIKTGRK